MTIYDGHIIDVLRGKPRMPTYIVKNWLVKDFGYKGLKTDSVRCALRRMEQNGKVKTVPSSYRNQLCWGVCADFIDKQNGASKNI